MNKSTPISQLPPSGAPPDEDDATIQEVLNHINGGEYQPPPQPPPPQYQMPMPQYPTMPAAPIISNPAVTPQTPGSVQLFLNMFGEDLKLAGLVATAVIIAHFLPVGRIIGQYIAIDRVPYHDMILKALLAAGIVILAKNTILQRSA